MNESIKKEIIRWSNTFPVDRWWRQKHNVAFGSKVHQETSFFDQLYEYYEDEIHDEHQQSKEYTPNTGDWLIKQERTEAERLLSIEEEARKEMENLPEEF